MVEQRAGDQGAKPSIHITGEDSKIAKRMDREDDSPSTLYSDALKAFEKHIENREKDRKDRRKRIMDILKAHESEYGEDARKELEKVFL